MDLKIVNFFGHMFIVQYQILFRPGEVFPFYCSKPSVLCDRGLVAPLYERRLDPILRDMRRQALLAIALALVAANYRYAAASSMSQKLNFLNGVLQKNNSGKLAIITVYFSEAHYHLIFQNFCVFNRTQETCIILQFAFSKYGDFDKTGGRSLHETDENG